MKIYNTFQKQTDLVVVKQGNYPFPLHTIFRNRALTSPENIALHSGTCNFSYSLLDQVTDQAARALRSQPQVSRQTVIGLFCDQSVDYINAMLAVLKAGCICVPINRSLSRDKLQQLLCDCNCELIISDNLGSKKDLPTKVPILSISELITAGALLPHIALSSSVPQDTAFIMHTSGSTGYPKGVVVTHEGVVLMALEQARIFEITDADRIMQWSAIYYDSSLAETFTTLLSGATLVIRSKEESGSPYSLPSFIQQNHISVITVCPKELTKYRAEELAGLRVLILAGDILRKNQVWRFVDTITCFNAYGLTETSVCATYHRIDPEGDYGEIIPVGEPLTHLNMYVVDENMKEVATGERGEICISGPGLSKEYLGKPQLTAEKFIPHPFAETGILFRAGDLGYEQEDGQFVVLQRMNKKGDNMEQEKPDNLRKRQDYILEFLRNEGYRPTLDEDDDIAFKREGYWYYINLSNDEQFYRILKLAFWPLENEQELQWGFEAASVATAGIKVAQVCVNNQKNNVFASVESLYHSTEAFTMVFERSMSALGSAVNNFNEEMRRLKKEAEEAKELSQEDIEHLLGQTSDSQIKDETSNKNPRSKLFC